MAEAPARIVAIHGFLGRPADWGGVADALRRLAPRLAFDTVELPTRDAAALAPTPAAWASAFNRARPASAGERRILLGYSMGGRLALQVALDRPAAWDAVVLVSAQVGALDPAARAAREHADAQWATRFRTLPWPALMAQWNAQPVFAGSHEPERFEADHDRAALARLLTDWSPARDATPLQALRGLPLLAYAGARDPKYVRALEALRDTGLLRAGRPIAGAGHRVIFDQPAALAAALVEDLGLAG